METMATAIRTFLMVALAGLPAVAEGLARQVRSVQARTVKIYGAGGGAGLESYQSGFLVSPEGHIATAWSYVLDAEPVVVLDDGRRFISEVVGFEPALELAVLKIDEARLPYFEVSESVEAVPGQAVIAASNLFGIATGNEPASVMYGHVAAITQLQGRRGSFATAYNGPVYILDLIANNPGAAGGAVVTRDGQLLGMLGKELQDAETGVWLNYAIPAAKLRPAIADVLAGRVQVRTAESDPPLPRDRAMSLELLGITLVPDVLERTPVFIDAVEPDSPAAAAGLEPDDLILLVGDIRTESQNVLREALRRIDRRDIVTLTVQRGTELHVANLRL